jgi:hypothetical protein
MQVGTLTRQSVKFLLEMVNTEFRFISDRGNKISKNAETRQDSYTLMTFLQRAALVLIDDCEGVLLLPMVAEQ